MNDHYGQYFGTEDTDDSVREVLDSPIDVVASINESRRAFLAAVGVTVAGAAIATPTTEAEPSAASTVGAPVLSLADLTTSTDDAYVAWRVDPTTAPLLSHLAGVVEGLDPALAPTSAFLARRGVDVPRYVETTAISATHDARGVAGAIEEWMTTAHGGTPTTRAPPDGGVEWRVSHDGWTEAVTIRPAGDWFLLVSVGGRADAALAPEAATAHYARLLAGRVGGGA